MHPPQQPCGTLSLMQSSISLLYCSSSSGKSTAHKPLQTDSVRSSSIKKYPPDVRLYGGNITVSPLIFKIVFPVHKFGYEPSYGTNSTIFFSPLFGCKAVQPEGKGNKILKRIYIQVPPHMNAYLMPARIDGGFGISLPSFGCHKCRQFLRLLTYSAFAG